MRHKWARMLLVFVCLNAFACQKTNGEEVVQAEKPEAKPSQVELVLPALSWDITDTTAVAMSPDGKRIAVGERRAIHVFDAVTLSPIKDYELGEKEGRAALNTEYKIERMKWSPDGRFIATTSNSGAVRLWDLKTGKHPMVTMYMDGVNDFVFSPSGNLFAASGTMISRNELEVFGVSPREYLLTLKKDWSRFTFNPSENEIWVRTWEGFKGWKLHKDAQPRQVPGIDKKLDYYLIPDGKTLLVRTEDEKVEIHRIGGGRRAVLEGAKRVPYRLEYSPDARFFMDVYDYQVRVWNLSTGKLVHQVPIPDLYDAAISNDGKTAAAHAGRGFSVWDLEKKNQRRPPDRHEAAVTSAALSPDGKLVATSCKDGFVRLWHASDGKLPWKAATNGPMIQMAFSPDGKRIAGAAEHRQLFIFDAETGKVKTDEKSPPVKLVSFGARGELMTAYNDYDGKFKVTESKNTREFIVKEYDPQWQSLSADGSLLIGANWEGIRAVDTRTGEVKASLKHDSVCRAASPDGKLVALGDSSSNELILWSTDGKIVNRLKIGKDGVKALGFSGDGKRLAVSDENFDVEHQDVFVIDTQTGKQVAKYKVKSNWVIQDLLMSQTGDLVVYRAVNDVGILRPR